MGARSNSIASECPRHFRSKPPEYSVDLPFRNFLGVLQRFCEIRRESYPRKAEQRFDLVLQDRARTLSNIASEQSRKQKDTLAAD